MSLPDFASRLATGELLILGGVTGSELTRRSIDTSLPLGSARALAGLQPDCAGEQ